MNKEIGSLPGPPPLRKTDSANSVPSLKSPRTPRFAEATSVESPIDPPATSRSAFPEHKSQYLAPQAQPGDIGFGYIGHRESVQYGQAVEMPLSARSPLKSALRSPGAPVRKIEQNPLSPTWNEEEKLEKMEESTEKEQAKDLKVKLRVRIAKMALRATNFSCSLIVLAMISTTFTIFNATRHLPPRNGVSAWSTKTVQWPNILLLTIACISLVMAVAIFYAYWRGGHKRAEKAAVYYTIFAVGFFVCSIVMWGVGAAALQNSRNTENGQDIWGWSCKDNSRKTIYQNDVDFELVCRLQNWALVCCIIEVVVEVITIMIYGIVFYRFYSKRRLRKSMANRDTARSDFYMAQMRSESNPGTPIPQSARFGPDTPRGGGYNPLFSPRYAEKEKNPNDAHDLRSAEEGTRYVTAPAQPQQSKDFKLQTPPPKKNTPKLNQDGFESPASGPVSTPATPPPMTPLRADSQPVHHGAAPGEQQYATVPIPGAIHSPTHPPNTAMGQYFAPLR